MSDELKPCPFCGGQPKIEPKNPERDGDDFTRIVCSRKEGHAAFASTTMYGENHKQKAITAWNTRADTAEIERLEAEVERLRGAAQAVIDRWHTPTWKDAEPTGKVIRRLEQVLTKGEAE